MAVTNDDTGAQASQSPLNVTLGGTGANLSATGASTHIVKQASVGAAFTLGSVILTSEVTGTLPVANGGTGVTTSTGSGANVLGTSPTIATPSITTPTVTSGDVTLAAGDLVISSSTKGFKSFGRTTQDGVGITPTFAAGNFTASGSLTWTVAAGDVSTNSYTLIGKTMLWTLYIVTTTTGGTASDALRVAIPGSFLPALNTLIPIIYSDAGGAFTIGFAEVAPSTAYVAFKKLNFGNWSNSASDNTAIYARLTFGVA